MRHLGLIGAGGMAETMLGALAAALPAPLEQLSVLSTGSPRATELLRRHGASVARKVAVFEALDEMLAAGVEVVAECAGHAALRQHGAAVLAAGRDLVVISAGALADPALLAELQAAAAQGGGRMSLPAGAVGGLDVLVVARLSGLETVRYAGRKPPLAWRGTQAERLLDLSGLTGPATFFEGTAREAASAYPQNANVAAAVALAGLGFDATQVSLVADPGIGRNVHEITARSAAVDFTIRLEGRASPANPKTSLTAGFSLAREVLNRVLAQII